METTDEQIRRLKVDNQALKEGIHFMAEQLVDLQNANEKAEYYKERYEKAFEKLQSLSAENEDLRKKNEDFQTILHEFAERVRAKAHWIQHYDCTRKIVFECSYCHNITVNDRDECLNCHKEMDLSKTVYVR